MELLLVELGKSISVFGLALLSFWAAIPTGFALHLHPLAIILITCTGYISGVLLFVMPARYIRKKITSRFHKHLNKATHHDSWIIKLWRQYGVIGFGMLAPLVTGAHLGALIGIALDIPRHRLIIWMMAGVLTWSVVVTVCGFTCVKLIAGS